MKELYSEALAASFIKRYRRQKAFLILIPLVSLAGFLAFLLSVQAEDGALFTTLGTLCLCLGGFAEISVIFFAYRPLKKRILQTERLLGATKKEGNGQLIKIEPALILGGEISVYPLVLREGETSTTLYYETFFGGIPFQLGNQLHYFSSENFVFSYEVKHE